MALDEPTTEGLSQLQLGIRELFRIAVPGAYVLILLYYLAPQSALVTGIGDSVINQILAVFFFGLSGYSLRVHERWWPYYRSFDGPRAALDNAIEKTLGYRLSPDHVHLYKYFLETRGAQVKDRVHYFSSFYYMLIEVSLFSFGAAIIVLLLHLTDGYVLRFDSLHLAPHGTGTASGFVAAALVVQVVLLWETSPLRVKPVDPERKWQKWQTWLSYFPPALIAVAVIILVLARIVVERTDLLMAALVDPRPWLLAVASVVFARLGAKQWASVIGEQTIFVYDGREELKKAAPPRNA